MVARRISSVLGLSHVPLDPVVTAFQEHFPEHGIVHHNLNLKVICKNFLPFLTTMLKELNVEGTFFCADSYHVLPDGAAQLSKNLPLKTIFLGYPNLSVEQKLADIRRFTAANDWAAELPDSQMRTLISKFIDESNFIQAECARLHLPFVDTGTEFNTALEAICAIAVGKKSP